MLRVNPMPAGLALMFIVSAKPLSLQAANFPYSCMQFIQNSIEEKDLHPSNKSLSRTYTSSVYDVQIVNSDQNFSEKEIHSIPLSDFLEKIKNGQLNGQVWRKITEETGKKTEKKPEEDTGDQTEDQTGESIAKGTEETGDFETPSPTALRDPSSSSQPPASSNSVIAGEVASSSQPSISLIEPPGQAILRELSGSSPSQILEFLSKLYSIDYSFSEQTKLMVKFTDEIVKKLDEFNKSQLMEIVFWLDSLDMDFNEKFIREWRKSAKVIRRQFSSLDRYWLYSIFRKRGISPEEAQAGITY